MRMIELPYSEIDPQTALVQFCDEEGLRLSARMALATCKGSSHWHISRPGERGTLEITWWPAKERVWLKVASNREGAWIDATILMLSAALQPPRP